MRAVVAALAALAFVPVAAAGGPSLLVGAAEDNVLAGTLAESRTNMDLARLTGLNAIRVTATWTRGTSVPEPYTLLALQNAAAAAKLDGIQLFLSLYPYGSSQTPTEDADQNDFVQWEVAIAQSVPQITNVIVGNEPNLNRFWLPQFAPNGGDVAAPNYEQLLARTYDALKNVNPRIRIFGGALAPRGGDRPNTGRDTHSPGTFITDMGAAYRDSGRTRPIMDGLAFHPYEENSSVPPTTTHTGTTIAIADYPRLVETLGQAFDGTAQRGSTLPILYDEFGVESQIPGALRPAYSGSEPSSIRPVDERTQASYYRSALGLGFCEPNVIGIFLFHTVDESNLDRWQSGLYYADGTPKSSEPIVRAAIGQVRRGVIAGCPGLELKPKAAVVFARGAELRRPRLPVHVTCDIDCIYTVRLYRQGAGGSVVATTGRAFGHHGKTVLLPHARPRPGLYRVSVSLQSPLNPGPPVVRTSGPVRLAR